MEDDEIVDKLCRRAEIPFPLPFLGDGRAHEVIEHFDLITTSAIPSWTTHSIGLRL